MIRRLLGIAAVLAAPLFTAPQNPAARPKFEVASIKECTDTDRPPPSTSSPGRLGLSCWPLSRLIAEAYETFATGKVDPLKFLFPRPLEGGPAWVNSARYSIDAKAEGPQSGAMMRGPMMQTLLEDRFQLKIRHETREVSVYIMTGAKGGPKLHRTVEGSCNPIDPTDLTQSLKILPGGKPWCLVPTNGSNGPLMVFDAHGMTLDTFSNLLRPDGRAVINRTGLSGAFDIHLEWESDAPKTPAPDGGAASDPSPHTSIMVAMREQLGLRLDPGKGTREFLMIDRVEKPSRN